jgi:hypothetical protein
MVKVIDYQLRKADDGREFFSLTIQGGAEMVLSEGTGNYYVTAKKASVTCTFDEKTCSMLLGKDLPGSIQKVNCDPYDFVVPNTAEVIRLTHRYVYYPYEEAQQVPASPFDGFLQPSKNGVLEAA